MSWRILVALEDVPLKVFGAVLGTTVTVRNNATDCLFVCLFIRSINLIEDTHTEPFEGLQECHYDDVLFQLDEKQERDWNPLLRETEEAFVGSKKFGEIWSSKDTVQIRSASKYHWFRRFFWVVYVDEISDRQSISWWNVDSFQLYIRNRGHTYR